MTTELAIQGMSCGNCVKHVDKAVRSVAGVTEAKVEIGRAVVTGGDPAALIAAIEDAGYSAAAAKP